MEIKERKQVREGRLLSEKGFTKNMKSSQERSETIEKEYETTKKGFSQFKYGIDIFANR